MNRFLFRCAPLFLIPGLCADPSSAAHSDCLSSVRASDGLTGINAQALQAALVESSYPGRGNFNTTAFHRAQPMRSLADSPTLSVPDPFWKNLADPIRGGDREGFEWLGKEILTQSPELRGSLVLDLYSSGNSGPSEGLLASGLAEHADMISLDANEFQSLYRANNVSLISMDVGDIDSRYAADSIGLVVINRLSFTGNSIRPPAPEKIFLGIERALRLLKSGAWLIIRSEESDSDRLNTYLQAVEHRGFFLRLREYRPSWKSISGVRNLLPDYGLFLLMAQKPSSYKRSDIIQLSRGA